MLVGAAAGLAFAAAPSRLRALGMIGGTALAGALAWGVAGPGFRASRGSGPREVSARGGEARGRQTRSITRGPWRAPRKLNLAASALAFTVVADSSLEHYRGGFHNPVMFVAPVVSGLTLWSAGAAVGRATASSRGRTALFGAAAATGLAGTAFHLYNMGKREGGFSWLNLFYAAPVGAPLGITFAGIFGLTASKVTAANQRPLRRRAHRRTGTFLASISAMGLAGTAAEAGLLHFRGAFHDPFMYLPVTLPPAAAAALLWTLRGPAESAVPLARRLLWSTVGAGLLGMGFHAYGIHRNMGGWYNWSQMIQQGPPVPAPPSFAGMALAGLAAIDLLHGLPGGEAE